MIDAELKVGATNARPASWPEQKRQQAAALQSASRLQYLSCVAQT
jgi:hypothetical protein